MRILTVGDGDLSYSLALLRALPHLELTATTLCASKAELCKTYSASAGVVAELASRGACVRYGVDATALDACDPPLGSEAFDTIIFNHPHLGLADLASTAEHARRHSVLVAHFLCSAAALLARQGCVRMALCGSQPANWQVEAHAARHGLRLAARWPTSRPPEWRDEFGATRPEDARPEWAARRRFRLGELGTRHYLAPWGYEHRRTESDADMRVDSSVEIILSRAPEAPEKAEVEAAEVEATTEVVKVEADEEAEADEVVEASVVNGHVCRVCGFRFADAASLATHVSTLALPDMTKALTDAPAATTAAVSTAAAAVATAAAAAAEPVVLPTEHVCQYCGSRHPSRTKLFKHLVECQPAIGELRAPKGR